MGQSSSKKRKNADSAKLSKDKKDNQVFELYNNNDKHNVVKFDDNTSNDDFSFSLSGDLNKEKLLCKANSKDKFKDSHKCKYEVIKAISTSAKLRNKNNLKKNYNLSIQTFRGDAVEYLLDVPYSNSSSMELAVKKNTASRVKNSSTHSKINVSTLFTTNKERIVPYNFNRTLTKRKQIKNRPCLELPPDDGVIINKLQQIKNRPCSELDADEERALMKLQQIKNRPRLELPSDSISSDNEPFTNLRQIEEANQKAVKNTNKNVPNTSVCSFCGYFSQNCFTCASSKLTDSSKEKAKPKKTYFYRCPVCQHLMESKNKKQHCNDLKPQKLSSLVLIDSDFSCKLNSNEFSCPPTSTNEFKKTGNLTEYFQTFQEFYLNKSVGSTLTSSKSCILRNPKSSTKNFKEKSVMCKLKCSKNEIEHDVSRDSIKLPPESSVLLLPPRSHKKSPSIKWDSILPKLINMPTNKVLYVVEVNRSDQKTQEKSEKKLNANNKQPGKTEQPDVQRINHKYVQIPSKCNNINYKCRIVEDASLKVIKKLEQTYNVKLKTLNEFLMQQPKYLISLLMNGKVPGQKIDYTPVKIPFDYNKFTMFLSSGV